MGRKYDREYGDKESFSPWESYSDLYCGLLLVFVLLFFFAIYQYIDAREKNNADTIALQESMKEEQYAVLAMYKADLEDQEEAYKEKNKELESQQTAMAIMQADLEDRTKLLDEQQQLINNQEQQMEIQQSQLNEQESLIAAQQTKLEEQKQLLESQAAEIEQIVGVRSYLIDELNRELAANDIQIQADQTTGALVFESNILFGKDSNTLSEEGKEFFKKLMPIYLEVLLEPVFQDYIGEIIIEGHTDDTGSYLHNLELSQQRAWSVAEYVLSEESGFLDDGKIAALKSLITINGCADKSPIYGADGAIDAEKSRRVEIKFRLKDQEMIQKMDEILNNQE